MGKTDALLRVASAGWEVVSADSMQVYRYMDIGTAKPDASVRARLPHHLIDIVDPDTQFSAGEFVKRAEAAIDGIVARGGTPVMSGGTAFYLKNFAFGLPETPPADQGLRQRLAAEAGARGVAALYSELQAADPTYAATIGERDRSRILRALEVLRATGRPLSSYRVPGSTRDDYRCLFIGLERPREELHARIERRVDAMFEAGLESEVAALRARGYGPADPGMKAIGYREFFECEGDAERARQLVKKHTRQYARRQIVFFRSLPGVVWIPADDIARLAALVGGFLGGR